VLLSGGKPAGVESSSSTATESAPTVLQESLSTRLLLQQKGLREYLYHSGGTYYTCANCKAIDQVASMICVTVSRTVQKFPPPETKSLPYRMHSSEKLSACCASRDSLPRHAQSCHWTALRQ